MEIDATKIVKVNAKTLRICTKVRDEFMADLHDQDGQKIKEYEGYVPNFMPGDHGGDYIELDIDIDTGQITNWKVPTKEQLQAFVRGSDD